MKMRKTVSAFLAVVMISMLISLGNSAVFAEDNITVTVNGSQLSFDRCV